jgi:small subunit ribosomal protein S17
MTKPSSQRRSFHGTVVSDKMDKTIVVKVDRSRIHSLYGKRFTISKKYKVHDPENRFKAGEQVDFFEVRPLSRDKRWMVVYPQQS